MKLSNNEIALKIERNRKIIFQKMEELRSLEEVNKNYEQESYRLVFELSSWVVTTQEFLSNNGVKLKNFERYLAFRHVFNSFKHNARIISVEKVEEQDFHLGGGKYKIKPIKWISSEPLDEKKKQNHQAYQNFLENKSVIQGFSVITQMLDREITLWLTKNKNK